MTRRKEMEQADIVSVPEAENVFPFSLLETEAYAVWINSISTPVVKARITINVDKMQRGLFGDWKEVGNGVFEMRMDFGPGYRVYYGKREKVVIILLGGGDKKSQNKDIANAQQLWKGMKDEITKF